MYITTHHAHRGHQSKQTAKHVKDREANNERHAGKHTASVTYCILHISPMRKILERAV